MVDGWYGCKSEAKRCHYAFKSSSKWSQTGPSTAHCKKKYEVLHETGHVLGFYHEHQRSDNIYNEDTVVQDLMKFDSINSEEAAYKFYDLNFKKPKLLLLDQTHYPFDKDSVMKYM